LRTNSELRDFAKKQSWKIVNQYSDHKSGKNSDRTQFKKMFIAASKREFDVLLFWSLDRLSREGALETLQHLQRLTAYGVAYRSFTEPHLDSLGPFRDGVISILAYLARHVSSHWRPPLTVASALADTRHINREAALGDAKFSASTKVRCDLRTVDDIFAWQAGYVRA
jgi:Resolvase, N terminal domain